MSLRHCITLHCANVSLCHCVTAWTLFLQVGLALSYSMPIVDLLNSCLNMFTETEKELVSVERVQQVLQSVQNSAVQWSLLSRVLNAVDCSRLCLYHSYSPVCIPFILPRMSACTSAVCCTVPGRAP